MVNEALILHYGSGGGFMNGKRLKERRRGLPHRLIPIYYFGTVPVPHSRCGCIEVDLHSGKRTEKKSKIARCAKKFRPV
jgi:hypothetical protein